MHLVSTFPFSLLRPCFLIWAYHVYIYIYFFCTLYRTSFSSVEYLKKCFLFKEDFYVFIVIRSDRKRNVIWISSFIHALYILLYFIQVSYFFPFFAKGLYVFTFALQCPVSLADILFYFILYAKSSLCKFCK